MAHRTRIRFLRRRFYLSFETAMAYGFTASGDSANYPALDALIGTANAINTGFSQIDQITGPIAGGGVGITFKDTCLYANASTL